MISNKKYFTTVAILAVTACVTFAGGIELGFHGESLTSKYTIGQIIHGAGEANQPVSYQPLWTVLQDLQNNYIDAKTIDPQKEVYGAISGAVSSLGDPYTTFFDPQAYQDFSTQLSGNFQGIGAQMAEENSLPTVVSTLKDSPASKSGLFAGDEIIKINGQDDTTLSLDDVVGKIRGPAGTQVTLTIFRPSANKQIDFTITRQEIDIKTVLYSVKTLPNGKKVEDITITEFGDSTTTDFAPAAQDAINNKVSGIVLDLRGNPGGYLNSAVAIGSYWLPKGQLIVTEAHADGTSIPYYSAGGDTLNAIPTVVLIDGGSASAAEILSGALHDHGIAKLVGEKSFGKGSVQQLITDGLPAGTALKVTIAKWLTPNGQNLNHNGLDPDVIVPITQQQVQANQDPQMDKALQTIQSQIK
jgi:carboxyl-terminal processing protease